MNTLKQVLGVAVVLGWWALVVGVAVVAIVAVVAGANMIHTALKEAPEPEPDDADDDEPDDDEPMTSPGPNHPAHRGFKPGPHLVDPSGEEFAAPPRDVVDAAFADVQAVLEAPVRTYQQIAPPSRPKRGTRWYLDDREMVERFAREFDADALALIASLYDVPSEVRRG